MFDKIPASFLCCTPRNVAVVIRRTDLQGVKGISTIRTNEDLCREGISVSATSSKSRGGFTDDRFLPGSSSGNPPILKPSWIVESEYIESAGTDCCRYKAWRQAAVGTSYPISWPHWPKTMVNSVLAVLCRITGNGSTAMMWHSESDWPCSRLSELASTSTFCSDHLIADAPHEDRRMIAVTKDLIRRDLFSYHWSKSCE